MKPTKLSAALLAAATAIAPLSLNNPLLFSQPTVFAEESTALAKLPDWIPTDFDSATNFRNTYGATHIENGLICIVFPESVAKDSKEETYGYKLQPSSHLGQLLKQEIYTYDYTETSFNVFVYQPLKQGDLELQIVDPHAESEEGDKPAELPIVSTYSFSVDKSLRITETDIFSWLPDCISEYSDYRTEYGEVSVRDNLIVFCLTSIPQLGDSWAFSSTNQHENSKFLLSSDCTMQVRDMYEDGSFDSIFVYQAKKDGYETLSWTRTSDVRPQSKYTLTADCAIFDDAQAVLLANTARIRFVNADTGALIDIPAGNEKFQLNPIIAYKNKQDGTYTNVDVELFADSNPFYWDFAEYADADIFTIGLLYSSHRKYYWMRDDYQTKTKYDNGAMDIVFKLEPNPNGLQKDTVRFTFVDAETGEPLQNIGDADAYLFDASFSYFPSGDPYLRFIGENFRLGTVPYIWDIGLHANAGMRLDDINSFSFHAVTLPEGCELVSDGIKKTLYEHNAMDVTVPLRYFVKGDVNKDGTFDADDVILLQKWLTGGRDTKLADWKAADLDGNGRLDAADLSMMKQELLKKAVEAYVEPDEQFGYGVPFYVIKDGLKLYRGPDTSYEVIASIPVNTRLLEKGAQKNNSTWLFTEYNGQCGWIDTLGADGKMVIQFEEAAKKPVIYLYPEQETDVHLELELTESELNTTYPKYDNGWDVTAYPDGTLLNKADGSHHRYLFWDSVNCRTRFDFSKGFCIAGSDTERFLKEKLTYMGLNEQEMNEFIVYWLPLMEHNAYNLIAFQGDAYTNSAKLTVTPTPDSECRIFMAYVPLDAPVEVEPQQLETFERTGFAVVEWGGAEIRQLL